MGQRFILGSFLLETLRQSRLQVSFLVSRMVQYLKCTFPCCQWHPTDGNARGARANYLREFLARSLTPPALCYPRGVLFQTPTTQSTVNQRKQLRVK